MRCPRCGHGAGIYRVAAEDRTASTPIRCLSCRHEAVIEEWRSARDSGPLRPEAGGGGMVDARAEGMIDHFMQDNRSDTRP